jgi:DNA mismatch repair protein MLH3
LRSDPFTIIDKKIVNLDKSELKCLVLIGQMDCKFILCKYQNLVVCLDQHAVDERIRLEDLESHFKRDGIDIHFPGQVIKFDERMLNLMKFHELDLKRWGIIIHDCGIVGYPSLFRSKFEKDVLKLKQITSMYLQNLEEGFGNSQIPQGFKNLLNSMACRSAVKFGDLLTREECQDLITKLSHCDFPFQCIGRY